VNQAEIDQGQRPGVTTEERRRITELERENRELRRANEILKAASIFFAFLSSTVVRRGRELRRRPPGALRGRADLPDPGDRPLHLLLGDDPPAVAALAS
jgi:hypothetical protein